MKTIDVMASYEKRLAESWPEPPPGSLELLNCAGFPLSALFARGMPLDFAIAFVEMNYAIKPIDRDAAADQVFDAVDWECADPGLEGDPFPAKGTPRLELVK